MKTIFAAFLFSCIALNAFAQTSATLQSKPTATAPAGDDWLLLQGATNGQRKLSPLYYQPLDSDLTAWANAADAAARRALIGAGTSSFDGAYSSLTGAPTIPAQFAPVAGTNITLSGTYPNITINASGGGTFDVDALTAGTNTDLGDTDSLPISDGGTEKKYTLAELKTWLQAQSLTFSNLTATTLNFTTWGTGTVPEANIHASLARDSEVTSAVAAEATARDTAIATAVSGISAGSLPVGARCDLVTGVTPPSTFLLADGSNGTPTITGATGTTAYIQGNGTVATPTVDVTAGTYTSIQSVTPSTATSGASMYYTFGSSPADPTTGDTAVSGAISVSATGTLKVRAFKSLYSPSAVLSAAYTINLASSTPTWVGASGTDALSATPTINLPTTQSDDIMIAVIAVPVVGFNSYSTSPPAGWTLIGKADDASTDSSSAAYWKRCTGSEGATETWVTIPASTAKVIVVAYRGCVSTGNPIGQQSITTSDNTATSKDCGPITTTTPNNRVVAFITTDPASGHNFTFSSGTQRISNGSTPSGIDTGNNGLICLADLEQATAGSVTMSGSLGTADSAVQYIISLIP